MKKLILSVALLALLIFSVPLFLSAQDGVRIAASTGTADPSALLDVVSTAKGILIPRMTAGQRTGITSPATGLLVYQTDGTPGFYYNTGTPGAPNWVILSAGAISGVGLANYVARWTTPSLLGTGVIVDNGTNVGIGVASPNFKLDVAGNISLNRNNLLFQDNGGSVATDGTYGIYWHNSGISPSSSYGIFRTSGPWNANAYQQLRISFDTGIQLAPGLGNNTGYDKSYVDIINGKGLMVSAGSVGIGTTAPGEKLHVVGKIKADQLDIAVGATIHIVFAYCGGGCASYHTLNNWTNVSAIGYNWSTTYNNAPDVFTHNNFGTITVNKTGTYSIKLYSMAIPASTVGWVEALIPVVNGSIDGTPGSSDIQYNHHYAQAGYWNQDIAEFRRNLTAGSTVQYAYLNYQPLSYWAHDSYTAMEITRIN